jgi:hypothetical protein
MLAHALRIDELARRGSKEVIADELFPDHPRRK